MEKKIDFNEFIDRLIIVFMCLILFSGSSVLSNFLYPFIITIVILILLKLRFNIKVFSLPFYNNILMIIVGMLLLELPFSYNKMHSMAFTFVFLCMVFISLVLINKNNFIKNLMHGILFYSVFLAITILLSVIIPNFIENYFSFILPANEASLRMMKWELYQGIYSGIACERAYAATGLSLGISVIHSEILYDKKIKKINIFLLILLFLALFCTGKRMLLFINIFNFLFIYLLNGKKENVFKFFKITIPLILILFIFLIKFPEIGIVFERILDSNGVNTVDTRIEGFWIYCVEMFNLKPLFGFGINTFVDYLSTRSTGEIYNAHNIYFQLLGEVGLVGIILFLLFFVILFYESYKCLRYCNKNNIFIREINFSILLQLIFLVYGISGNTLYYYSQLLFYFIAIIIINNIKYLKMDGDLK